MSEVNKRLNGSVLSWYALAAILRMVTNYEKDYSLKTEIMQMVYSDFTDMVNSTYEKSSQFKKIDGSFSYYKNETSYTSQGSVVAVAGTNEGDVNATAISSSGLLKWMFDCLGVKMVPMSRFRQREEMPNI